MSDHLFLVAMITPKTEHYAEAKAALTDILPRTRQEAGCHQFFLHEGHGEKAGTLILYEEFTDQTALDLHYSMEYTKHVFEKYINWLARDVEITKMKRLD